MFIRNKIIKICLNSIGQGKVLKTCIYTSFRPGMMFLFVINGYIIDVCIISGGKKWI